MSSALWRARRRGERPVIYGRERERAQLRELLDDAMTGHGSLVLISGEAGIGKTTLVDDLLEDATERGCLVLAGGCYDLTATPPYGPWSEALADYEPTADQPAVPAWFGDPVEFEKLGGQGGLFSDAMRFLSALSNCRQLVIVLEDLHWTDEASLELLRYVSRRIAEQRLLLIATYRDDEVTRRHPLVRLLPALVREAGAARISAHRLESADLDAIVSGSFALAEPDARRLSAYVNRLSGGNPLYAVELLHHLRDAGTIQSENGRDRLGNLEAAEVSPLLQQLIERRLTLLDEDVVGLLEAAAVIGQEFQFDVWARVSECPEDALLCALDVALRHNVLEEVGRSGTFRFRHALIREALYQQQIWPRRRARHLKVAEALMRERGVTPDTIVYHLEAAGDERVIEWLARAGYQAERTYAWREAVDRFERALNRLANDPDRARERGWLHYRIGCLLRFSEPRKGLDYFDEAHAIAMVVRDSTLLACAQYGRGLLRNNTISFEAGLQQMAEGIHALENLSIAERVRVNRGDVFSLQALPPELKYSPGKPQVLKAFSAESDAGVQHPLRGDVRRRAVIATILMEVGRLAEAREWIEAYLKWIGSLDRADAEEVFMLFGAVAKMYALSDRPDLADPLFPITWDRRDRDVPVHVATAAAWALDYMHIPYQADAILERKRLVAVIEGKSDGVEEMLAPGWSTLHHLGFLDLIAGNWDAVIRRALPAHLDQGRRFFAHKFRAAFGAVAYRQGTVEGFRDQCARVLPDGAATEPGETTFLAALPLQRDSATLAIEDGDFDSARSWLNAHDHWLEWSGIALWRAEGTLGWAAFHRACGDPDKARECAEQARELASAPRLPLALIAAERFLGQLDVDEEMYDKAKGHLDASLELAKKCEAPFEQALTLVVMVDWATKLGEVDEARRLIRRVREICEPLGAKPTLERVDEIEAMLPRTRRGNEEHPFGLTGREVEVLRLVAQGMTDAEAAEELFISPRTASQHMRSVYNKLAANNRAEATRIAVEQGIV